MLFKVKIDKLNEPSQLAMIGRATKNLGHRNQLGTTLLEVMISVFVFAIGVLGFSALQTRSLQANFDNVQREDVVWMSESLVARIRVNRLASSDYVAAINGFGATCPVIPPAATCAETQGGGAVAACNETELANYDVWDVLCGNQTGGIDAVNGLNLQLTCEDAIGGDADTCSTGSDLILASNWCAKSIEAEDAVDGAADANCANAIARQTYQLEFRP